MKRSQNKLDFLEMESNKKVLRKIDNGKKIKNT